MIFLNIELFINREKNIIETKYYVKPTNQRLFLNYRSNHPTHVFKAIVYGMALQGTMVNSRDEWNLEYLVELREKFLQQEYPLIVINEQYEKALEVDRLDLVFKSPALRKNSKKKVIAPLILTYNPGNPPVRTWINEGLEYLHSDDEVKKILPHIYVVFRQDRNVKNRIMKNRYRSNSVKDCPNNLPPAGNFKLHANRCKVCERMEDGKQKWKSNKTKREYKITRHYTCQTTFCIYLATCELCQAQYVGQTIRTMRKRHYGHRSEVKTAADGLGEHFNIHAAQMGLNLDTQMDQIMQYCKITIIASVEPDQPWSKSRLDALEADLQDRMMTLEKHGGMNRREERRRIGS